MLYRPCRRTGNPTGATGIGRTTSATHAISNRKEHHG